MEIVIIALLTLSTFTFMFLWLSLRHSIREIAEEFREKLTDETNTFVTVSSSDPVVRAVAVELNLQLGKLKDERRKLQNGDRELKEAIINISHDIRTPLTVINGYLELLEREEQTETQRRYISIVRERTDALKKLAEELFKYSIVTGTVDKLTIEKVSLNDVLEESLAAFYGVFTSAGIVPQIIFPERAVERQADKTALRRIFSNILNNAVKYSDGELKIVLDTDGTISFSNKAIGLDFVQTEKLFDRFYTVNSARNSTGLGLHIAKLLTERMGGKIYAEYKDERLCVVLQFL